MTSQDAAAAAASSTSSADPKSSQQEHSTTPVIQSSSSANPSNNHATGRQPTPAPSPTAELSSIKISLKDSLRHFADFPIKGIDFVDIMPLFMDAKVHSELLRALELQVQHMMGDAAPDVVVGLDARGFLFGPAVALRFGAGFGAVRKKGKLPGPCVTASYEKEYGADHFQMQEDAIKPGQKVLVVDDIIATGGSATAAGQLVKQLGGQLVGYLFILEIPGLNGKDKLGDAPVVTLLEDA